MGVFHRSNERGSEHLGKFKKDGVDYLITRHWRGRHEFITVHKYDSEKGHYIGRGNQQDVDYFNEHVKSTIPAETIDYHFQSSDHIDPDIASEMVVHVLDDDSICIEINGYGSWINGESQYLMLNFDAEKKERLIRLLTEIKH